MASVKYYLEKRKNSDGIIPNKNVAILLSFSFNGERMWIGTGERIDANKWDEVKQRVKSSATGAIEVNNILEKKKEDIMRIYRTAVTMGIEPSKKYIKDELNGKKIINKKSVYQLYEDFIETKSINSLGTVKKLKTNLKHLKDFAKKREGIIEFKYIDDEFIGRFEKYYLNDLKHTNNTVHKNIANFKWFLKWASKNGYSKEIDLNVSGSIKQTESEIIALNEDELKSMMNLELKDFYLAVARDAFVFSCLTGLRFSDVKNLKKEDIGESHLNIIVQKTKQHLSIPLNNLAKEILNKYKDSPILMAIPLYTGQKVNNNLKKVGAQANLNRMVIQMRFRGAELIKRMVPLHEIIHFHCARRTFISYMFSKGVPSEIIMKISNHKTHQNFSKYNNIQEKQKAEAINSAFIDF